MSTQLNLRNIAVVLSFASTLCAGAMPAAADPDPPAPSRSAVIVESAAKFPLSEEFLGLIQERKIVGIAMADKSGRVRVMDATGRDAQLCRSVPTKVQNGFSGRTCTRDVALPEVFSGQAPTGDDTMMVEASPAPLPEPILATLRDQGIVLVAYWNSENQVSIIDAATGKSRDACGEAAPCRWHATTGKLSALATIPSYCGGCVDVFGYGDICRKANRKYDCWSQKWPCATRCL